MVELRSLQQQLEEHSVIAAALLDKGAEIKTKMVKQLFTLPLSKAMPMWWKSLLDRGADVQVRNHLVIHLDGGSFTGV